MLKRRLVEMLFHPTVQPHFTHSAEVLKRELDTTYRLWRSLLFRTIRDHCREADYSSPEDEPFTPSMGDSRVGVPPGALTQQPGDLWHEAIKLIEVDQQKQLAIASADKLAVLNGALIAAKDKRDQCLHRQWKYKRGDGTVIVFRDIFDRIASWIQKLKDIGDLVAKLVPTYAEIPWAAVSFFVQVSLVLLRSRTVILLMKS